ncbi:sensor histidine kinase [Flavitalea sp. BT771]|uniref:sensor histidine kinase n=1 Tax=Flavitalea sp. BT771 TaxID=3063329 RepID=UPI0026E22EE0|nr:sensor histidine kinase [Flavitalea sp. BT771]MDO6431157.1 sensor histidine kinase [Flavitalea sp. BT771]MDV6220064.1 sensor histidine kinase [Flavitalea sp. BT771]
MKRKQLSKRWLSVTTLLLWISILLWGPPALAQYYPAPARVPADQEPNLLQQVHTSRETSVKVHALLDLANIHYNKPIKTPQDFPLAVQYSQEALRLSRQSDDPSNEDESLYTLASAYILEDSLLNAENLLPLIHNDTIRNNLQVGLAFTYIFCPQRPLADILGKGKAYCEQAQVLSKRLKLQKNELLIRQYLAIVYYMEGHEMSGEQEIMAVIQDYKRLNMSGIQYPYLVSIDIHWMQGRFTDALNDIHLATAAIDQSPDKTALADLYWIENVFYGRISEHGKEDESLRLGLEQSKKVIGRYCIHQFIDAIVYRMIKNKEAEKALAFLTSQVRTVPPITFDQKNQTVEAHSKAYLALGRYKQAEQYFLESFAMLKRAGWLSSLDYGKLGYFYLERKEYAKARPYLLDAQAMQDNSTTVYEKRHLAYELFLVDSAAKNYTSAIKYLNLNHALNDSIENTKRRADVEKLMIQFETQKKDAQIAAFAQKEQLARARQERADFVKNVVIAAAIVLLITAAIVYRQYLGKKKLSEIIAEKSQKQQQLLDQLNRALTEKEWLLKEVHHRVKNNLHTVMCLLESQSLHLQNDALKALDDSKHRIYAMSLIHQQLYETEDMKTVDLKSYIAQFTGYLKDSFDLGPRVHFELNIQPVQIDVPAAIPLALIINEAVTNSIKHAFQGISNPLIEITLRSHHDQLYLRIRDNGIGIANVEELRKKRSLGMKLIHGLSEDLNGLLTMESNNGLHITIECPIKPFAGVLPVDEVLTAV